MPAFFLAVALQLVFHGYLEVLPLQGRIASDVRLDEPFASVTGLFLVDTLLAGQWRAFGSALQHLVLPVLTLTIGLVAIVLRYTRNLMIEVLRSDHVRTAFAYGLPARQVYFRYSLRATLVPLITVIGLTFGYLLGGSIVVEYVFDWPGLGSYVVNAVVVNDTNAALGVTLLLSLTYLMINLAGRSRLLPARSASEGGLTMALMVPTERLRVQRDVRRALDASWRFHRQHPAMTASGLILLLIILAAVFAPLLAPFDPTDIDLSRRLQPPGWTYLFGTDALGRDIFSQVLYGGRLSLLTGLSTVTLAVTIGVPVGVLAAYYGGWIDALLMRTSDLFLAFPPMLLPIAMTAVLGPGLFNAMVAIGIAWFPWYARLMRATAMSTGAELYVKSAKCVGMSDAAVIARHILPNSMSPLIVQASMDFGYAILAAAALSFIGAGAQPPAIEWGLMVSQSRIFVLDYLWVVLFPGLAIFITVLTVNVFADGVRDVLDPNYNPHT